MENMADFSTIPVSDSSIFKPFTLDIPDAELDAIKHLLEVSRVNQATFENTRTDGSLGVTRDWMKEALSYWKTRFDWFVLCY